jgi:hypothetical protein
VNKWKKNNSVPTEVIQDIETFDLSAVPTKQAWTDEEKSILQSFFITDSDGWAKVGHGHTIITLAAHLTNIFGRKISEGSIKSKLNAFRLALKSQNSKIVQTNFAPTPETAAAITR